MDREAAVIRAEISQTRADLDRKLVRLESRARELAPRRYATRMMYERRFQQILGGVLLCAGVMFAWTRHSRRAHVYDFRV